MTSSVSASAASRSVPNVTDPPGADGESTASRTPFTMSYAASAREMASAEMS